MNAETSKLEARVGILERRVMQLMQILRATHIKLQFKDELDEIENDWLQEDRERREE